MNCDVVAINLKTHAVRLIAHGETEQNAEAIVNMAVMRRGVEEEIYAKVAIGMYKDGDTWIGEEP